MKLRYEPFHLFYNLSLGKMEVCLGRAFRCLIGFCYFLETHLVVIAHVENRLLLGRKRMDGFLQSHGLLIAKLEIAV